MFVFVFFWQILRYNGELQGQSCPGFSWLLFNTPVRSDSNPRASSRNFTFGDEDQKTVKEMIYFVIFVLVVFVKQSSIVDGASLQYSTV